MSENCVIYISSTNYRLVSAGTEKFMAGLIDAFKSREVHSIQIFPLVNINEKISKIGLNFSYIGINVDGIFEGVYLQKDCLFAISFVCKKFDLQCDRIIINQLHNWNLELLSNMIKSIKLPVFLVVHDYMMVCPYMMRSDGQVIRCGRDIDKPNYVHCIDCLYEKKSQEQFEKTNSFFCEIKNNIERVIFPSSSARENWLRVFPYLSEIAIIRPHLKFKIIAQEKTFNSKIKIAYLGVISDLKGYLEWKELLNRLDKNRFEFYYFGKSVEQARKDGANAIEVDFNKKNTQSMVQQLRQHEIDIALLWSNCLETYSYTYYEATEAGCWIVTSSHSGNITDQVSLNKNGKVFDNIEECFLYLNNINSVVKTMRISDVINNYSISDFTPSKIVTDMCINKKIKRPNCIMSQLYRCLRRGACEGKN